MPEEPGRSLRPASPKDQAQLKRLTGYWGMLADLCFSDLLLCVPEPEPPGAPLKGISFVVVAQVRPATAQTLHRQDLVGREVERPVSELLTAAWRKGEIVEGDLAADGRSERQLVECIPVYRADLAGGSPLAVVSRHRSLSVGRVPGLLERTYFELFDRFARMLVEGVFPYPHDDAEDSPRVGDGVLVLDESARISFASPNAVSALHHLGVQTNVIGMRLGELGLDDTATASAFRNARPVVEEVEGGASVVVRLRCLPLLSRGRADGALVLMRDVTDLRRRDRMLLSKDATIREIHHRVKNNLQTISSLLRLQRRRLAAGEAREALAEAERRIRSIAVVHDLLARDVGDQVSFGDIVNSLILVARESVPPGQDIRFVVEGDPADLPAGLATPLAVVASELLQNAVEHAFVGLGDGVGTVAVSLDSGPGIFEVTVRDDGVGLPPAFQIDSTTSLGLTIVRDLVQSQLGGHLELRSDGGLVATVSVPIEDA